MLTGVSPFPGLDVFQIMSDKRTRVPTPPRKFDSEISVQLDVIVMRALAQRPQKRFCSIGELGWVLSHPEILIQPDPETRRSLPQVSHKLCLLWDVIRALAPVSAIAAVLYCLAEI
jgi:hypothetical protein